MARTEREYVPGGTYHVICRGNRQQAIFRSASDYRYFCNLLANGIKRFDHSIIAYCLMTNHAHFAIKAGAVSLSTVMHAALFRYAQVFNAKYNLSGHLFQDRHHAEMVDSDEYFDTLISYIHLNPVKAGMVESAGAYPWSSYRAYSGEEEVWWLSPSERLRVPADMDLGEPKDLRQTQSQARLDQLLIAVAERLQVDAEALSLPARKSAIVQARAIAAVVAKNMRGVTLKQLAPRFGQTPSALSKAASRVEAKLRTSADLARTVSELTQKFTSS